MAQKHVYLQGKCKWARLQTPDDWGNWKLNLYLTPESKKTFEELKVKNHLKRDDDGDFVAIKRPQSKIIKGRLTGMSPPVVLDKDGGPTTELIGNGSDVTVKCDYYSYKTPQGETGNAIRLSSVRIDTLVPYTPSKDYTPELAKAVGKLNEQPKQEELF